MAESKRAEDEAKTTCRACGLCENRRVILGTILGRLATLLDREEALTSPSISKELKQQVENGRYVVAQMLSHAPARDHVPPPIQEDLQRMPLSDFRGVGRARNWGMAALMCLGEGGRATHRHPR